MFSGRLRRGLLAAAVGLAMLVAGAEILGAYGAEDPSRIESVWDVIGGLVAGVGLCLLSGGAFMAGTALRWHRTAQGRTWTTSRVRACSTWFLAADGRTLVHLPDFDPATVYSVGVTPSWNREALLAADEVEVAGRPGQRLVIALDGRWAFMTARPLRLRWTARRWGRALADAPDRPA